MITKHTFVSVFLFRFPCYVMKLAKPHYRGRLCCHFRLQILTTITTKINVFCDVMLFSLVGTWAPTFRRNVLPLSSGDYTMISLLYLVI